MLRSVVDNGTGRVVREMGVRGPIAGKTGTTNKGADVWFIGYTPTLVAGVWFGYDSPRPIGPQRLRWTAGRSRVGDVLPQRLDESDHRQEPGIRPATWSSDGSMPTTGPGERVVPGNPARVVQARHRADQRSAANMTRRCSIGWRNLAGSWVRC